MIKIQTIKNRYGTIHMPIKKNLYQQHWDYRLAKMEICDTFIKQRIADMEAAKHVFINAPYIPLQFYNTRQYIGRTVVVKHETL